MKEDEEMAAKHARMKADQRPSSSVKYRNRFR
jgi:hypothetical protein